MSLWVDKYRPTSLSKLDYHKDLAAHLKKLVHCGDFPHLLVYGPSGAGKKTRIMCILRELYGPGVEKLRIEQQSFTTPSNRKIEMSTIGSAYHLEINPSDAGIYDRVVVQELIKTVAQSHQLDSTTQKEFKVVVLTEVDRLTKDAQHSLRRTMEKYTATCRLVLCCNSTSKVIPAIRSRCLGVRVAAPSICQILHNVCKKEGLTIPAELSCFLISFFCSCIFRLLEIRGRFYELLTHCIPPDVIFKGLIKELVTNCDGSLKAEVTEMAAHYEHRIHQGNKAIYHLEAFVAKFMSIYKRFLEEGMADLF
ncbi:replication factor C subunit 3-like [Pocillopora damicornis]|uniref:replication factor C subunit 3-like n=1 Tax=Pocillopora damicornis TaxID=46731 RepID=UPI000F5535E1|nr:replication factor C subunit 3-like [Pocillopora damicornis]